MGGIAGIAESGRKTDVERILRRIAHRGKTGHLVIETDDATLGAIWTKAEGYHTAEMRNSGAVHEEVADGHFARAQVVDHTLVITRDQLGVAPLYYGSGESGELCFASEVKGLLEVTRNVKELLPGHRYDCKDLLPYFHLKKQKPVDDPPEIIAKELHRRLAISVENFVKHSGSVGSWLSGGIDSSTMAALARPHVPTFHTFAAGVQDAPDLEYAREVAEFIRSEHHEVILNFEDLLSALPDVIYHLESFDALLVRSSITNYLVSKSAGEHVSAVISGEGGDELLAGYEYLNALDPKMLADELIDITSRLHNTALQRVDRCASAHGTVAHVGFLDPQVVDYAVRIPTKFKLREGVEKWILRRAMDGSLPKRVLNRRKSKFWEGAGVSDLLERHAEKQIGDDEFRHERTLPNGWILNSKEELMYYRIFRGHFGELSDLSWMGRTKGAPKKA
jgi:asparagine synthase (glutamine-hydrolysing)